MDLIFLFFIFVFLYFFSWGYVSLFFSPVITIICITIKVISVYTEHINDGRDNSEENFDPVTRVEIVSK